jgi:hypothetical protein
MCGERSGCVGRGGQEQIGQGDHLGNFFCGRVLHKYYKLQAGVLIRSYAGFKKGKGRGSGWVEQQRW